MEVWENWGLLAVSGRSAPMDRSAREVDLLDASLAPFLTLTGDRRTTRLLAGTVRGIIGSESLVCARIAAFSPWVGDQSER